MQHCGPVGSDALVEIAPLPWTEHTSNSGLGQSSTCMGPISCFVHSDGSRPRRFSNFRLNLAETVIKNGKIVVELGQRVR